MPRIFRSTTSHSTGGEGSVPWAAGYGQAPFEVGIQVTGASTTLVTSVQYTLDPIFDNVYGSTTTVISASLASWATVTSFSSVTAMTAGVFNTPCVGIRAFVTSSSTQANVVMTLLQSGP